MIKKGLKLLLFVFVFAVLMIYLRFGCEDSNAIDVMPKVVGSADTDSIRINFGTIDTTYYPAVLDADSLIILVYPPDNAAPESTADGGAGVFNLTTGYYQYHRRGSNATPDLGVYTVCVKAWRGSAVRGIGACSYLVTPAGTYHYGVQDSTRDLAIAIRDTTDALLDTLQAGFGSRTAIGDTIQRPASVLTAQAIWTENLSGYVTANWAGTFLHGLSDNQDWNQWDNLKTDTAGVGMGDWFADWFKADYWLTSDGDTNTNPFDASSDKVTLVDSSAEDVSYVKNHPDDFKATIPDSTRLYFADKQIVAHVVYETLYVHRTDFQGAGGDSINIYYADKRVIAHVVFETLYVQKGDFHSSGDTIGREAAVPGDQMDLTAGAETKVRNQCADANSDSGWTATRAGRIDDFVYFWGACDECYYRLYPEGGQANKDSAIMIDPSLGADSLVGKIIYKHGTVPAVYDSAYFYRAPWW